MLVGRFGGRKGGNRRDCVDGVTDAVEELREGEVGGVGCVGEGWLASVLENAAGGFGVGTYDS